MDFPQLPKSSSVNPLKWATIVMVAGGALVLLNPFKQIASGYCGIRLNFGSVQPVALTPGLHFALPVYQRIEEVSTQPQTTASNEWAATHDLQDVHTTVSVTFHINPVDAPSFYRDFQTLETLEKRIIGSTVSNDVKAITAKYNAEELITKRDMVDSQIKELIITSLVPYHLSIEAVNTANFTFSPAYSQAIEVKQVQANAAIAQSLTSTLLQQKALNRWSGILPTYLSAGVPLHFIANTPLSGK
nr:prohibitin family protein [uncultured Neokomagataea sp.]